MLEVFPFALVYRHDLERGALVVLAVAHFEQRPGYWEARDRDEPDE